MYCPQKDYLYCILMYIKARFGFASWRYDKIVEAIHRHERSGHKNGQPCPDGKY